LERIFLSIAGFTICLISDENFKVALEDGYLPFIMPDPSDQPNIIINVKNGIPAELRNRQCQLFEAKNETQKYFSIHQYEEYYKFIIYDQQFENHIQQVALLDKEYTNWVIYSDPKPEDNKLYPLQYPLGPIILYYLTVKFDAIMIHASGISDEGIGRVFTGFSGTGKSTMADLWQKEGSEIINDDRLIIRCNGNKYVIYNTPMFYKDVPKKASLDSIYLISHAKENIVNIIEGAAAITRILAFCIQHNFNHNFIKHHLEFLEDFCKMIKVYEVGFTPDKSIVDLIKSLND